MLGLDIVLEIAEQGHPIVATITFFGFALATALALMLFISLVVFLVYMLRRKSL